MRYLILTCCSIFMILGVSAQDNKDELIAVYSDSLFIKEYFYTPNILVLNSSKAEISKEHLPFVKRSEIFGLLIDLKYVSVVDVYSEGANHFLLEEYKKQSK